MTIEAGDLCVIVGDIRGEFHHLGKIITAVRRYDEFAWHTSPVLFDPDGRWNVWVDSSLRPIRDNPGADETLRWLPVPSLEFL